jgi:ABC-type branched-subunit amino acid transport system substrate-binding protein
MPDAKVGLFLQDDDFGADAEKGFREYIDSQVVEAQRYTSGNTDVAPQITALQASGADLVLSFTTPSYTALGQLVSLKLGYTPKWYVSNVGSWDQSGQDGDLTNYRIYGMSFAYTFVQALEAAGEDLTRDGLVKAIEDEGGDFAGPQFAPYRYSSDSHLGISGMQIVELQDGVGKPLTDVLTTDTGDAEIAPDDSGQGEDAPPESGVPE